MAARRRDFALCHDRLFKNRVRGSTIMPLEIGVQPVRANLAFVRWSWRIVGGRNMNRSVRPPRVGLMLMLAEKRGAH